MSFHSEDRAKYVENGQCLCDKTLESATEYFENIFKLQVADGSLAKKCKRQIEHHAKPLLHQALRMWYNKKVHRITEQSHGSDGCHSRQSKTYYQHDDKWKDPDHSNHCHNYDKREKKQEDKTPSDCGNKAFKPCSMHGPKSNHTFEECYKNPKNQDKHQAHDKTSIWGASQQRMLHKWWWWVACYCRYASPKWRPGVSLKRRKKSWGWELSSSCW